MTAGVRAVLAGLAAHGPWFAVEPEPGPGWLPLTALTDGGPALAERVAATRAALAASAGIEASAVERRVAASITQLGLAARLVSPLLALATGHGLVLDLDPAGVRWQAVLGRPFPLSVPAGAIRAVHRHSTVDFLADALQDGPFRTLLVPLGEATGRLVPLAGGLLRGNLGSATAGAAAALSRPGGRPAATPRPPDAPGADPYPLVAALLRRPALAGTGVLGDGRFRRRSCCLLYRVPGGGWCGDCPLTPAGRND